MSGRRLVLLGVSLLALAAPSIAVAAAPTPADDTLPAIPTGALDVLANDSDPDGDALRVTSAGSPAHGTVTCRPLGACFYTAASGYTGPDAFTYTVSDGGSSATATVTVDVAASTATDVIAVVDDDLATRSGEPVAFNVLSNDRGKAPLDVQSSTAANHGTATCSADGACQYTPGPGFTGRDGFTYVLHDSAGQTRTGTVHIAVAPAGATFDVSAGGSAGAGDAFPGGSTASWFVRATPVPGDLASDELRALPLPDLSFALAGAHSEVPGSQAQAPGWTPAANGASATGGALLGSAFAQRFPRPLPPISQGTGGDGHVPILVGSKVFAFFHHASPTSVTCVDRATGAQCPGYSKQLNVGTSDINGPGAVSGDRIWTHLLPAGSWTQSASIALYCWDASTDSPCGMTIVDRMPASALSPANATYGSPGASAPVLVGGRLWFGAVTGKLYCVEPESGDLCPTASLDTGLTGEGPFMDIVSHGSRVFVSRGTNGFFGGGGNGPAAVACIDVAAGGPCDGWATPKSFGNRWDLVNQRNAAGSAIGVCVLHGAGDDPTFSNGFCVPDAAPSSSSPITQFPQTDNYYSVTAEAEAGTRTLVGHLGRSGLGCYDWAAGGPCTGGSFVDGQITNDKDGASLPSAYGAVFDGACVIAVGDPGRIFTVDPAGTSPCTSLRSGSGTKAIDLRAQRCDGGVGAARWKSVVLTDSSGAELDSLTVTVRDARTGQALMTGDLIGGTLDISGIDAGAHPSLIVDGSAAAKNATAPWDDGVPPRLVVTWVSDPQSLCVRTSTPVSCGAAPAKADLSGRLRTPAKEALASLTVTQAACPVLAAAQPTQAQPTPTAKKKRKCTGRRRFNIRVRYRGSRVRRITVTINGRRQKVLRLRPRPIVRIDLVARPKQTVKVRIKIITTRGKKLIGKRVYKTCAKKGPNHGFRL